MKRFLCCGILAASVVATHVIAQSNVYSINIVGHCPVSPNANYFLIESSWQIGSAPFNFGYEVNSWGPLRLNTLKSEPRNKHTVIFAGPHSFRVRGDISRWLIKAGCLVATFVSGLSFWFITTPRFRLSEPAAFANIRIKSS